MRDTRARAQLAMRMAKNYTKQQRDNGIRLCAVLCCVLLGLDVAVLTQVSHTLPFHPSEDWLCGASMLPSNAGGYIMVAIVAFIVAVVFTVCCMKQHERTKQQEEQDQDAGE